MQPFLTQGPSLTGQGSLPGEPEAGGSHWAPFIPHNSATAQISKSLKWAFSKAWWSCLLAFRLPKRPMSHLLPVLKPTPSPHSPSAVADPASYFTEKTKAGRQAYPRLRIAKPTGLSTFLLRRKDQPPVLPSKANPPPVLGIKHSSPLSNAIVL